MPGATIGSAERGRRIVIRLKKDMNSDDTSWFDEAGDEAGIPGAGPRSDQQRLTEDDDLRDSLAGLSRLGTSQLSLEDLLTRVATYAVRAIPGADGAGLTLLEDDRADTIVSTASFLSLIHI